MPPCRNKVLIIGHCHRRLPRNYRRELPLLPDNQESGPRNSSAPPISVQGQGGGKAEERARPVNRGARPGKELVGAARLLYDVKSSWSAAAGGLLHQQHNRAASSPQQLGGSCLLRRLFRVGAFRPSSRHQPPGCSCSSPCCCC